MSSIVIWRDESAMSFFRLPLSNVCLIEGGRKRITLLVMSLFSGELGTNNLRDGSMTSMMDLIVATSISSAPQIASPLFFGDLLILMMSAEISLFIWKSSIFV